MPDELITGIDIGTSKVATVVAQVSEGESQPRIMGFSSVESRGVRKGQIVDINQVTQVVESSIEKAERMAGSKVQSAFVSVGGPHIESINSHGVVAASQPDVEITESDVSRAIDAARAISISSTREVIEVSPREYIVDGQGGIKNPLGMSGVRLEVNTHIITASLTNLRNIDRCLSDLGVTNQHVMFSGLASSLAVLTETEKELGVVCVDIGGGKTDICMYVEGALSSSSSIPIGARHITNDIAVGLRISLDSAEKVKVFLSSPGARGEKSSTAKKDEIDISSLNLTEGLTKISEKTVTDAIIRPRLEELFEKVLEAIEKSGFVTHVPSGLVIAGGGALTAGSLEAAKRVIGMPARIGTPHSITGLVDEVLYPQYATVVGLLLYARSHTESAQKLNFKNFDKIFRNLSVKGSMKKVTDLFKTFVP
jgi:cell division protein FtsA